MARQSVQDPSPTAELEHLSQSHWKQFRDVRRPKRVEEKLDHVLVGPSGIYVIDYCDESLRRDGASFDLAVAACSDASRVVGDLLPVRYRSRVKPIVCFRVHEPMDDVVDGVTVTSFLALEHILRSSPVVLSTAEVSELFTCLRASLERIPAVPAASTKRWTVRRWLAAAIVATAAAAGGLTLGPELIEAARLW